MSRRADVQALALQLAVPALAHDSSDHRLALYGGRWHTNRRVVYERRQQHLFGRWTEERITIELDERHWLDHHENTNQTAYGRGMPGWQ